MTERDQEVNLRHRLSGLSRLPLLRGARLDGASVLPRTPCASGQPPTLAFRHAAAHHSAVRSHRGLDVRGGRLRIADLRAHPSNLNWLTPA